MSGHSIVQTSALSRNTIARTSSLAVVPSAADLQWMSFFENAAEQAAGAARDRERAVVSTWPKMPLVVMTLSFTAPRHLLIGFRP